MNIPSFLAERGNFCFYTLFCGRMKGKEILQNSFWMIIIAKLLHFKVPIDAGFWLSQSDGTVAHGGCTSPAVSGFCDAIVAGCAHSWAVLQGNWLHNRKWPDVRKYLFPELHQYTWEAWSNPVSAMSRPLTSRVSLGFNIGTCRLFARWVPSPTWLTVRAHGCNRGASFETSTINRAYSASSKCGDGPASSCWLPAEITLNGLPEGPMRWALENVRRCDGWWHTCFTWWLIPVCSGIITKGGRSCSVRRSMSSIMGVINWDFVIGSTSTVSQDAPRDMLSIGPMWSLSINGSSQCHWSEKCVVGSKQG